jgi:plastocyanin
MKQRQHLKLVALAATAAVGATVGLPALAPAATKHRHHQAAPGKTRTVGVSSDYYDPAALTIRVGDRIRWVWRDTGFATHDVNVDSGPEDFHSPTQGSGDFAHRFKKSGIYKLYCTQHETMTMTVTVKKAPK